MMFMDQTTARLCWSLILIFSIVLPLIIDQVIKYLALKKQLNITILPFFKIELAKNYGASFNLLDGKVSLLIIINILAIYFIYRAYLDEKNKKLKPLYLLVISGALSNLLDRFFRGYVVDYLSLKIFNYQFPIFNIADTLIVIPAIIIIIFTIQREVHIYESRKK